MSNSQLVYKNEITPYKKNLNKIIEVRSPANKIIKSKTKQKTMKKY